MKEFVPNIDEAKKQGYCKFSGYSRAYIVTNEDLRLSMNCMPTNCNKALTVAASGDHPLFCSLYGAKHVDTFDISYNAKCIMDIKTAAISELTYYEYLKLLANLHNTYDIAHVPYMSNISQKLSSTEYDYMCAMSGYRLFNMCGVYDKADPVLPNGQEYRQLQKIVQNHYNFYWTDLSNLNTCLVENYDFVHLSNIFDYICDRNLQFVILERLVKHLNIGGRIVIQHLCFDPWDAEHFAKVSVGTFFNKCRFIEAQDDCCSIFERIR